MLSTYISEILIDWLRMSDKQKVQYLKKRDKIEDIKQYRITSQIFYYMVTTCAAAPFFVPFLFGIEDINLYLFIISSSLITLIFLVRGIIYLLLKVNKNMNKDDLFIMIALAYKITEKRMEQVVRFTFILCFIGLFYSTSKLWMQ